MFPRRLTEKQFKQNISSGILTFKNKTREKFFFENKVIRIYHSSVTFIKDTIFVALNNVSCIHKREIPNYVIVKAKCCLH